MKRRSFLSTSIISGLGMTLAGSLSTRASASANKKNKSKIVLKIGVCTDLHQDLIDDGPKRLQEFINEMNLLKPDLILQNGDFCTPKPSNKVIMDIWNQFKGPKYHVIGNHDIDGGFTHDQVIDFWGAKGKYYSFDHNNYHLVVLNGNERPPNDTVKGYPRSITPEQLNWLKQDLDASNYPVIVFCHQGIDNDMDGINEGDQVRIIFERANQKAGYKKVRLVISGHHHEDYLNVYNDINYVQINSISYQFNHLKTGYSFALTKDPLWAFITIYDDGSISIKGKRSSYINPIPAKDLQDWNGYPTVPTISDRIITI